MMARKELLNRIQQYICQQMQNRKTGASSQH